MHIEHCSEGQLATVCSCQYLSGIHVFLNLDPTQNLLEVHHTFILYTHRDSTKPTVATLDLYIVVYLPVVLVFHLGNPLNLMRTVVKQHQ